LIAQIDECDQPDTLGNPAYSPALKTCSAVRFSSGKVVEMARYRGDNAPYEMSDRALLQTDWARGSRCLRRNRLDSGHTLFPSGRTPATVRQRIATSIGSFWETIKLRGCIDVFGRLN
jgi:hypothetical protein